MTLIHCTGVWMLTRNMCHTWEEKSTYKDALCRVRSVHQRQSSFLVLSTRNPLPEDARNWPQGLLHGELVRCHQTTSFPELHRGNDPNWIETESFSFSAQTNVHHTFGAKMHIFNGVLVGTEAPSFRHCSLYMSALSLSLALSLCLKERTEALTWVQRTIGEKPAKDSGEITIMRELRA